MTMLSNGPTQLRDCQARSVPAATSLAPTGGELLRLSAISKSFPGVRALHEVSLALRAGEVLGIVGENGAGKSTLLKILGGILQPDEGEIWIDGVRRPLHGVRDAMAVGIGLIHQELNLAPALSVAENLYLGRQPSRGPRWLPITHRKAMYQGARRELRRVGLTVAPEERLGRLDIARRQLVEIAKSLATQARMLIFDEPTSSLALAEADRLLAIIEELRRRGTSIIYVSHRLEEVQRIADRVLVLRDGRRVGALGKSEVSRDRMISLMVGRDLPSIARPACRVRKGTPALEVKELQLTVAGPLLNFHIQPGEIVGFAGIVGAGRTEVARALFGIDRRAGGEILIHGARIQVENPVQAICAGLALVPEDRKTLGVILDMSIRSNMSLAILGRLGKAGWYNRHGEEQMAQRFKQALQVRSPNIAGKASALSGGNQQKVVLAKWLATEPKVFILDEPTRGVDVAAKQEIYRLIGQLAEQGVAVLLISSEMEEIVGVSDRVLVMHRGAIAGELSGVDIREERIMELAVGAANGADGS